MTEETQKVVEATQEEATEEEPQVFAVKRT